MKKIIVLAIAAVAAVVSLSAFASASDTASEGKVSFESTSMPALNCTMSIGHAWEIYRLVPFNIEDVVRQEYVTVRQKCKSRSRFTHEGVDVRVKDNGETVSIELGISSCKLTFSDVTWRELDNMFIGQQDS